MKITSDVKKYIKKSVLCWLATSSTENIPNVSPKEVFDIYGDQIIIANIASPQSISNIEQNEQVCISFIDILVQKGYQIKGEAKIINRTNQNFESMENVLKNITQGKFPFETIITISPTSIKQIIAPKYILYPETTEEDQIKSAKDSYNLNH